MSEFAKPKGINFSSESELPAIKLSKFLCETVSFIQRFEPRAKLERYDDWWEHDGLHFHRGKITFDELFHIINSPKNLLEAMTGDFEVFIGVAPENNTWYLRFYLDWDKNNENVVGRFDVTFPIELSESYENEFSNQISLGMKMQNAEEFYQSIIL